MPPLLELHDVTARYGPVRALHGVTLSVEEGSVTAVLGANGAGKTTTLRAISNTVRRSGEVVFDRQRLRGGPDRVARLGIAHVPEGRGTFGELSVWDNLRLGAYPRRDRAAVAKDAAAVLEYFPWIASRRDQPAGTLSGGEQQMLAIGRALMARPRLLMLDEPSLGLAPMVVREIFRILGQLNERDGLTMLVVEQNAAVALRASDHACVLEVGRVVLAGTGDELRKDESIRKSYLGY